MKYALSSHITCRKTNSELLMLFDRERGVMYELNESASAIVSVLNTGPKSRDELIENLEQDFEGTKEEIANDLDDFLNDFERSGLIMKQNAEG